MGRKPKINKVQIIELEKTKENNNIAIISNGSWFGTDINRNIYDDVSNAFKKISGIPLYLHVNRNVFVELFKPTNGEIVGLQIASLFGKNPYAAMPWSYIKIDETLSNGEAILSSTSYEKISIRTDGSH